ILGLLLLSGVLFGCSRTTNPVSSPSSSGNVTMSAVFSNVGEPVGAANGNKTVSSVPAVDSIRIDSAIVVLAGIRFEREIDTVTVDTADGVPTIAAFDEDSSITFPGPFVIHVGDTNAINFASRTLPAGTYSGIKFAVLRLGWGDHFFDSRSFNDQDSGMVDSAVMNYSIVVWGAVYKDTAWVPFEFKDNQDLEFAIKGSFAITTPTSSVNIALNFNMGSWFVNPFNGAILDPTNNSWGNYAAIQEAIRLSFGNGRCGPWNLFRRWGY
ncbi:MAG: hypothetical protein ACLP05_09980, partial [Candidatus Kryptoniota bacterium]